VIEIKDDGAWIKQVSTSEGGYVNITVTKPTDPAYWLLTEDNQHHSIPNLDIFREGCYICRDPEFAQMGLPLCKPCEACKVGHVAADDTICDECGADAQELYMQQLEEECKKSGHVWKEHPELRVPKFIRFDAKGKTVSNEFTVIPAYTSCEHCERIKEGEEDGVDNDQTS
jgi:hypothetical protein